MADYEGRHWHGWHRPMPLVLLAHTWLKLLQHAQREKKSAAHLAELRYLLNIVLPTPALSREFPLRCFWQRRK